MNKLYLWAKLLVTFFSVLEPLNKLFHLLQKNTLSFCKMCIFIPLEDGFFTQNFSCKMWKSNINTATHSTATAEKPQLAAFASSPKSITIHTQGRTMPGYTCARSASWFKFWEPYVSHWLHCGFPQHCTEECTITTSVEYLTAIWDNTLRKTSVNS